MADIFAKSKTPEISQAVRGVMYQLSPDMKWSSLVLDHIKRGIVDIRPILYYLAWSRQPKVYLEIGVRRGWSMAMVAAASPDTTIYGFDLWIKNYADSPNPGPEFIRREVRPFLREPARLHLISGNSHRTVPDFFDLHPEIKPNLILVDGDHTLDGARIDLANVLPHLAPGGYLVFDDLDYGGLRSVFRGAVQIWSHYESIEEGDVGLIHHPQEAT